MKQFNLIAAGLAAALVAGPVLAYSSDAGSVVPEREYELNLVSSSVTTGEIASQPSAAALQDHRARQLEPVAVLRQYDFGTDTTANADDISRRLR